jgi:hypothetical protein
LRLPFTVTMPSIEPKLLSGTLEDSIATADASIQEVNVNIASPNIVRHAIRNVASAWSWPCGHGHGNLGRSRGTFRLVREPSLGKGAGETGCFPPVVHRSRALRHSGQKDISVNAGRCSTT